jgi:hypothetical protein
LERDLRYSQALTLVMADYLFASPVSDVSATAWQHIAMFVSFGAIGAAIAWVLFSFLVVLSQDERDISER